MKTSSKLQIFGFLFVIIIASLLLFVNLSKGKIYRWDESTNIETVKSSSSSDTPLILTYQGEQFFEKPPLWYYITQGVTSIFGYHVNSFRAISSLSGIGISMLIYVILKNRYTVQAGLIGALSFLAISQNVIPDAFDITFSTHTYRSADLDPLQMLFIMLSIITFGKCKYNQRYWFLTCIFIGLAYLTKGPLAVLFLFIMSFFFFIKAKNKKKIAKIIVYGWIVMVMIILPWHLLMYMKFGGEFVEKYFTYHILGRTIRPLEGHNQGVFFYLQLLSNILFVSIWPLFIVGLLQVKYILKDSFIRMHLMIVLTVLLLITAVQTKLAWYLLPLYPSLSIFIGATIHKTTSGKRTIFKILVYLLVIITIGFGLWSNFYYVLGLGK